MTHQRIQQFPNFSDFVDQTSQLIQTQIDSCVNDPEVQGILELTDYANDISEQTRNHEILIAMKLLGESELSHPKSFEVNGVNFRYEFRFHLGYRTKLIFLFPRNLYRFLYSSMSGYPTNIVLDQPTIKVLFETYEEVMKKVNEDATPENLQRLQSILIYENASKVFDNLEIQRIFEDYSTNLFNFPFEECLTVDPDKVPHSTELQKIDKVLKGTDVAKTEKSNQVKEVKSEKGKKQTESDDELTDIDMLASMSKLN